MKYYPSYKSRPHNNRKNTPGRRLQKISLKNGSVKTIVHYSTGASEKGFLKIQALIKFGNRNLRLKVRRKLLNIVKS